MQNPYTNFQSFTAMETIKYTLQNHHKFRFSIHFHENFNTHRAQIEKRKMYLKSKQNTSNAIEKENIFGFNAKLNMNSVSRGIRMRVKERAKMAACLVEINFGN